MSVAERALARFTECANSMVMCKRCDGRGYHHGFGPGGHSPDWCEVCGGSQSVPEFTDLEAMREAIKATITEKPVAYRYMTATGRWAFLDQSWAPEDPHLYDHLEPVYTR